MNISRAVRKAAGFLALTLAAFTLAGAAAARQTDWQAQQVVAAPDGTSRVLWTADTVNGTVAGIWKLDAGGNKTGSGPVYGPYTDQDGDWYPQQLAVAPNGTCRLFWSHQSDSGTQAVVWALDANGNRTSGGTTYGPYSDVNGDWSPKELEVASDGTSHLLWVNTNDMATGVEAVVWTLNSGGSATSYGSVYGPYFSNDGSNWEPYQLLVAPDGTSRLLWVVYGQNDDTSGNYTGDTVGVWSLDGNGKNTGAGLVYGPYKGWGVANIDFNTGDSSLRLLWDYFGTYDSNNVYSGDAATVWSLTTGGNQTKGGPVYGPYTGWSADAIAALPDGTSRLEWTKTQNSYDVVSLWGLDANDSKSFGGPVYGPYTGWILQGIDINRSDNSFRLLWTRDDDAAGLWTLNSNGSQTSVGPVFGPYVYNY